MHAAQLIERLNAQGIRPYVENGKLKTRSDSAVLDPHLVQLIRDNRDALIAFLSDDSGIRAVSRHSIPRRADASAPAPMSFAQQRLWFIDQFDAAASVAYHVPSALRLSGVLDRAALKAALDRIVARHEVLRTTFVELAGQPVQKIAASKAGFALAERDLSSLDAKTQSDRVHQLAGIEASAPFDLAQGPLIRGCLLRLDEREHVLLLTLHHIVSDGWSTAVLVNEFSALYTAFCQGAPDPLPELELQYADYACWQREHLSGELLASQIAFWRRHLQSAPALITLPADRARRARPSHAGDRLPLQLSKQVSEGLHALARRHGASLFMVVMAAWSALLSRISGQAHVVIGSPVANRNRPELEPLIGFFANTLALHVDLEADPSVAELLTQVRTSTLAAQEHQDLPFEQVVEALQPERNPGWNPLFQVMLTVNASPRGESLALPGLELRGLENAQATTQFDLSLTLSDSPDGMVGGIVFATDLFDRDSIVRLGDQLQTLMAAMVADDAQRVSRLPLLTVDARAQLLSAFSTPALTCARDALVHRRFESQVARDPSAIALVWEGQTLSYGELNARANRLAHRLIALGVRPDDRVAICVERGLDMVVGILGILKSGAAYVPLDPVHPVERLGWMIEDSAPVVLLSQASLAERLQPLLPQGLPLQLFEDASLVDASDQDPVVAGLTDASLAYVIYTSGSTGLPKGVMVEHGHVARLFTATEPLFGFDEKDVWTLFHSFAFDFSVWELWGALCYGGRLVLVSSLCARTPSEFWELVSREGVTVLNQTPTAFRALIAAQAQSSSPHTLRYVIFGGEALELHTLSPWIARNDAERTQLINMYGITEITVHATYRRITSEDVAQSRGSLIGRALPDLALYVLDAQREPVPVGVTGELYVGGGGVARGYLNRAELSAERFLANPFDSKPGSRLYKTGDLGRWLPDGTLEYLGRNDFQVKIRGFRIELGEIEARLSNCAGVREAVVIAREDVAGDKRLVAYLVAGEGEALSVSELRETLSRELAEYMVPSAFVMLEELPLTANGKLDREALPAPDDSHVEKQRYVAPRDAIETALVGIWQEILGLDRIGIDDSFFRLGGHSLLATRVVSEIAVRLQRKLPVRDLFESPTVRGLAERLATQAGSEYQVIPVVARDGHLPLSFAQQRLWFIDQVGGGSRQYHIPSALKLDGRLDQDAVQRAMDAILERHEVLRTRFVLVDGQARLCIDPPGALPIPREDLSALSGATQQQRLQQLIETEAAKPFDLAADPMLRCRLVLLSDDSHVALLTMHHIASDGWSTSVLIREFAALYEAFRQGLENPLAPLALQYADFAAWQRDDQRAQAQDQGMAYWQKQLAGIPRVHGLPLDRPRPAQQRYSGGRVDRIVDAPLVQRLGALAEAHDASLFMLLHGAFSVLLARWSNETDIVIGSPVAGRVRRELEPLIGFFVNSVVLRTRLADNPAFTDVLAQTRQTALDAYAHQSVPFDMLVEALNPERSLNHAPVFQISFSFHNHATVELTLPELEISHLSGGGNVARFDIELHISEHQGRLNVAWLYSDSIFDRSTIERLADSFATALAAIVQAPHTPVQSLSILPPQDANRLAHWCSGAAQPLPQLCAHELFEARVRAAPDAIAAVFEGEHLSYAELNAQANQVAHYLRAQGVTPDTLVGLCVERSLDMLVGMLGILKAGAAYLALDPTYPEERLADMIDDAGVEHVLTQSAVLEALPVLGERSVLPLDADMRAILLADCPQHDVAVAELGLTPRHLAYAIYTSGSTGKPKGVLLEHRGMVNLAQYQQAQLGLGRDSRVMAFASLSFDGAVFEWLMALASGGSLHICSQNERQSTEQLSRFLLDQRITHCGIPPALLGQVDPERDYALELLIVAGEACEESLAWRWAGRGRVCNSYGPSEATVAATHAEVLPGQRITLGHPLPNVETHVLNAQMQPQPIGVAGELMLGGAGLARGYLNQPELTAQRFVAHPQHAGERLYRTGDLARWLPNGELQFLGRADDQVKIRGFRIELGEIETRLLTHEQVKETVVVVRQDEGNPRLVAYVVCPDNEVELPNEVLLAKEWRAHLRQQLPDYMVPAAFVVLDQLPLNANGKVDRRRLPEPDYQSQQLYVAPRNEVESRLAEIWQQVLRLEQVGVHDNFFEIGGDSILSIQVVSRATQSGIGITTKQLFEVQTIAGLAQLAESGQRIQAPQVAVEGSQVLLPIHHLFFGSQDRDPHHYNQAVLLRTPQDFDASALHPVIAAIYHRHDALRLRFVQRDGHWEAAYAPYDDALLIDSCIVEPLPSDVIARESFVTERCGYWQERFDLQYGPLLRAVHFADPDGGEGRLLLLVHHAVVDGVSWRVLLADVEQAWRQVRDGQAIVLEAKTSSFQQWGEALAEHAHSAAIESEKAYWLAQCATRVPSLPVDRETADLGEISTTRTVVVHLDSQETPTAAATMPCGLSHPDQRVAAQRGFPRDA
jgi:amino acid adenylation domain-containing protein